MKIYKYWARETGNVMIYDEPRVIHCYGGSNVSLEDAARQASWKYELICKKVAGDQRVFDSYQVEIREEIVRSLNNSAVVTRNRYGAEVLNVETLMILDIDKAPITFWDQFIKPNPKEKIMGMVRSTARKRIYQGLSFRIYETFKGVRVIVLGKSFDPKSTETRAMMRDFNSDPLYNFLCAQQDCFRARLTPKPGRIKLRAPKTKFPREPEAEADFQKWLMDYEMASRRYSACRFVEQIGNGAMMEVVRLHDELSGALSGKALA